MPRALALAALAALVVTGCKGGQPAPVVVSVPRTVPTGPAIRLTASETNEAGETRKLNDSVRAPVDVNSSISITPFVGVLPEGGDTTRISRLRRRIDMLSGAYAAVSDSLESASASMAIAQASFLGATGPNRREAAAALDKASDATGKLLRRLREAADSVNPVAADALLNEMPPDLTKRMMELVSNQSRVLLDSLSVEMERLARTRYQVEMTAVRYSAGRPPVQVHLPGYDNLGPGDPLVIDKLTFARSQEEQEQLDRTTAAISLLVQNARSVSDVVENFTTTASKSAESIVAAVEALGSHLKQLPVDSTFKRLADTIPKLVGGAAATELQAAVTAVAPLLTQLKALETSVAAAPAELRRKPDLMGPFDMLQAWVTQAQKLLPTLDATAKQLTDAGSAAAPRLTTLSEKLAALRKSIADPEKLRQFNEGAGGTLDRVAALAASIDTARMQLAAQVDVLRTAAELFGNFASANTAAARGEVALREVRRLALSDAGRTTLDLVRTDRREGDHVLVTLRVIDPQTSRAVSMPAQLSLDVKTFGWHRKWTGGLAFARHFIRKTDDPSGMFPGVSASWITHFRRRADQTKWFHDLQSWFNPRGLGLGLTSVMFTRDDGLELGFGPTVTLFGDLLQVGAGINVQTERTYVLLNTPLLELFRRTSGPERD